MIASRRSAAGESPLPAAFLELAAADRARKIGLLKLGLAYLVAALLAIILIAAVEGDTLAAFMESAADPQVAPDKAATQLADPRLQAGFLLRIGLGALLSIPFWHAPALVFWGAQGWAKSLFFSTVAIWRNKGAFAVYGLVWLGLGLVFAMLLGLVARPDRPAARDLHRDSADLFCSRPSSTPACGSPSPAASPTKKCRRCHRRAHDGRSNVPLEPGACPMKKVAIVTGAGSGIGRASALALLEAGWHVALAGRRADALEATRRRQPAPLARNAHRGAHRRHRSGGREGAVRRDAARPSAALDLLFNNAGMGAPAVPLEDLTVEQWKAVVDINLTAVFLCTQEAFRVMKEQTPRGGRIINNGSISAHAPRPTQLALHRDQARHHRPDQGDLARRPRLRHRLRPDRHRQRRHRDDRAHDPGRAAGQRRDRGRAAHGRAATWPTRSSTWPACRSMPTCSS